MIDNEGLKYIDYDLDIKVIEDYSYTTLDRNEYNKHKAKMEYPSELKAILEKELQALKVMIEQRVYPFDHETVRRYYQEFLEGLKNE